MNKAHLQNAVNKMDKALIYTKEMTTDPDHGYAFSYGYLHAQALEMNTILKALLTLPQ
jgi:hypothetical protein